MSYTQFGYSYSAAPQILLSSNALGYCYEPGSTSPFDSAQTSLYCPVYEDTLVTSARHDLSSPYGNGYTKEHGTYSSYRTDSTCLYSLGKVGEKVESRTAHARVTQESTYYSCDPPFGQYQYETYGYGSVDVNARRKNATRETTSTLKTWLQEHKKNPYPTKGEKIMLAIITKMTLTQVSTWFANARRRLKKENKMTWSPRNKTPEERGCDEDSDDVEGEPIKSENEFDDNPRVDDTDLPQSDLEDFDLTESDSSEFEPKALSSMSAHAISQDGADYRLREPLLHVSIPETSMKRYGFDKACLESTTEDSRSVKTFCPQQEEPKSKIWSLAQTAASLNHADNTLCTHRGRGMQLSSPGCHPDSDLAARQERSPFASLRNWVDGMFHDPLFRHSNLNQTFSNSSGFWTSDNRFHELKDPVPSPQLT